MNISVNLQKNYRLAATLSPLASLLFLAAYISYEKIIGNHTTGNESSSSHYLPILLLLPLLFFCIVSIKYAKGVWKILPILGLLISMLLGLLIWFTIALSNWSG